MFGYCFSFSTLSSSSFSVFLSVTKRFAPIFAKNSASPTPRPSKPNPIMVIFLSLKKSWYVGISIFLIFRLKELSKALQSFLYLFHIERVAKTHSARRTKPRTVVGDHLVVVVEVV